MISRPEFTPSEWEYAFVWKDEGVRALLERFSESRGEIWTELTIDQLDEDGRPRYRLYGPAKFNLLAMTVRVDRDLKERLDIDWQGLLTQVKALAIRQYREGSDLIDLASVDISGESPRFLLPPFVDEHGVTVLVADGGTGKSVTALGMAVAVAACEPVFGDYPHLKGPVVYLDWEADEETHAERLQAICRGIEIVPPVGMIHYMRMITSLHESVASLRKKILDVGAAMVVIDSVGMARGGAPESAEETIRLFRAIRSLGRPVLAIDHISKETKKGDQAAGSDPIGSVYTRNSARLVWSMEGKQFEGQDNSVIVFRNSKANFGKKERQRAYRYNFVQAGDRLYAVTFNATDWRDTEEFADRVPVRDRILRELTPGKLTVKDLSERTGASDAQVRARLAELRRAGFVMEMGGGTWGKLAEPRDEA